MRILFDAHWWLRGPVSNQQILHLIVKTWMADFPRDEVVLAVRRRDLPAMRAELGPRVPLAPLRLPLQGLSAIIELPRIARREKVDFILSHNFTPFVGRSAVFIQDVLFLTNPEWFTAKERLYFSLMPLTAWRATLVFASSGSEARRIESNVRGVRHAIPVGLAVNPQLIEALPVPPPNALKPNQFVLTVGRLNIRKNLEFTCVSAIRSGGISSSFPLVVAGSYQGRGTTLTAEMQQGITEGSVVFLGHVTTQELAWLYRNARAFVFMSLDEGFGLPPIEALSLGTEVVVSDIPVMHELLGDRATYVNNSSFEAMEEVFRELTAGTSGSMASSRASDMDRFSWSTTVSTIRSAMTSVLG